MIVYDLVCEAAGHRFEGWFSSSDDFDRQQARGLVTCPQCGSAHVTKAVMAPRLTRKGNQHVDAPARPVQTNAPPALPPEARAMLEAVAKVQAEALKQSQWVGDTFADKARAMHYGEQEARVIHGRTTPEQAKALIEEGVEIAPVLIPIAPPDEIN